MLYPPCAIPNHPWNEQRRVVQYSVRYKLQVPALSGLLTLDLTSATVSGLRGDVGRSGRYLGRGCAGLIQACVTVINGFRSFRCTPWFA